MKLIVVVDDNQGMMFNHRRQSKDAALREQILKVSKDTVLWMNAYTRKQFSDVLSHVYVSEQPMDEAQDGEYCFVEDRSISAFLDKLEEIVIFKWNRTYPSDLKLGFNPAEHDMVLVSIENFEGTSHEKITMEVWGKNA